MSRPVFPSTRYGCNSEAKNCNDVGTAAYMESLREKGLLDLIREGS